MILRLLLAILVSLPAYAAYSRCISITGLHGQIPNTDQAGFIQWVCMTGGANPTCSAINTEFKTVGNGGKINNLAGGNPADFNVYNGASCNGAAVPFAFDHGYSATTGTINFWFRATRHTGSDDSFSVAYGDPAVVTTQATPTSVWPAGFAFRYSLSDGTTIDTADSSVSNNPLNAGVMAASAGWISGGVIQCGTNNCVLANTNIAGSMDKTTNFTICAMGKTDSTLTGEQEIMGSGAATNQFTALLGDNGNQARACVGKDAVAFDCAVEAGTRTASTWYSYCGTGDGTNVKLYINGTLSATAAYSNVLTSTGVNVGWFMFARGSNGQIGFWLGSIDEPWLNIGTAFSADYIKAYANDLLNPSTFFTIGAPVAIGRNRHRVISN